MQANTFSLTDFGGGIDLRDGIMASDTSSVRESVNYITTSNKKRKTRPPRRLLQGSMDASTQGARFINGKLCVIAPRTAVVNATNPDYSINVLRFDTPDGSLAGWELVDFRVMGSTPVALIKHAFNSTVLPYRYFLHVWDDTLPSYVSDPACPYSWYGDLPLYPFGEGKLNPPSTSQLRIAVAGNRVWMSMGNGNVKGSAVNRPRVWTQRTPADILSKGEWYYHVTNSVVGTQSFLVPIYYGDLTADQRYAAYLFEVCLPSGIWQQFNQLPVDGFGLFALTYGSFSIGPVPAPWDATKQVTKVQFISSGDGAVVRFRAIARPPVVIENGVYLNADGTIVSGVLSHEGKSHNVDSRSVTAGTVASTSYYIIEPVPDAPLVVPLTLVGDPGSMPLNGRQRYWSRIIAVLTRSAGVPAFEYSVTGTVTIVAGSSRVDGVGTLFQDEVETGRVIEVNGERRVVKTISGNQTLEVDVAFGSSAAGALVLRDYRYRYAYETGNSGNAWYAEREAEATFKLSGTDDAVTLPTAVHDPEGNVPLSLAATQNRLLVQYPSTLQLWGIDPSVSSIRQLSVIGQGAGTQTRPDPVLVDGWVALPTSANVRLFAPDGMNKDYINFNAIGDRLDGIVIPNLDRAIWWHTLRCYITVASTGGTFYVLSVHPDGEVMAWDTWELPGVASVDAIITAGDDLLIRSGSELHRLRVTDTVYQDDGQPTPIPAHTRWDYLDLGRPQANKRITRLEIYQRGSSTISFYMNPYRDDEHANGPRVIGRTIGLQKVPMAVMGPGIALKVESLDVNGHALEQIDFDFMLLKR